MALPTPDTSTWLVATKLHPPLLRGETIRRPHLEQALSNSITQNPVTLISAPAGYGKTTLLATLPHLLPDFPLAWVTLDEEDNDPIRFVGLLATACQRLHPACGRSVWPLLGGGADPTGLKRAVGALVGDIMSHLRDPFILVLDDLHAVTEPAVFVALEYLLDHQPAQLHIALGTRHDPPLRLARLAARRQLGEVRRPALGFTPDEAGQLLNDTLGLRLAPADVAALQERTEGWPAGLCLLAGPLARIAGGADRTQFLAALSQSERYALDFLAEEVLRSLDDDLRRFLLETSVLPEMTPSLCQAVTGRQDAGEVLDRLYRQNLTLACVTGEAPGEPVFRHHALFARLLTRQLERELPGAVAALHERAARAQKTPGRAIAHYLSAGLWAQAAQMMAQSGMALIQCGMSDTVRKWYSALPADMRQNLPRLDLLMGACELHRGDYITANLFYEQARAGFQARGDMPGEGEALAASITIFVQKGDRETAAALADQAEKLPLIPMAQARVLLTRAWLGLWQGDWAAIRACVRDALAIPRVTGNRQADLVNITFMCAPLAAVPGCLPLLEDYATEAAAVSPPHTAWRLGAEELTIWPLLWRGQIAAALAKAEECEALRQRLGGFPFIGNDLPAILAILQTARGDLQAAGRALDTLVQRIETAPRIKWPFYLHAAGRSLAMIGRQAEARVISLRLGAINDQMPLTEYLHDHLAGLLAYMEGRGADAAAALARAAERETQLPIAWNGGSARLLQARLHLDRGRPDAALAAAAPVLREWEQAGTPGCALLDGPAGLPVLRLAAQHGDAFAARLVTFFAQPALTDAAAAAATLPEPLTARECDVLRLVVAGRSNPQIAAELFVSAETVKSHVAHILRKLDVTTRTQAAIRGRELGF
ncbi:MAG TPA: LuxR C-terminal-related transcriptional regulator [Symbiobacteriaceae bacterium]|nr:LuxR C-terminal-related transcriptional regulator [Symbiobacteriaceae bacterium]